MLGHLLLTLLALLPVSVAAGAAPARGVDARTLAQWLQGAPVPKVLDLRGREAYRAATVPGAQFAGMEPAGYVSDGRGGRIVLVWDAALDPQRLGAWIARLTDAGHEVYVLDGGITAWRAAGFEVEQGTRYTDPGSVPFNVPRGLCESREPAQEYR